MAQQITTDRLVLRPYHADDVPEVVSILGDLRVSRWLAVIPHPFTKDDVRIFRPDGSVSWPEMMAIEFEDRFVGCVSNKNHLGYYLAPTAWGQGIMSEAVTAALMHVFVDQDRDAIASGYFEGNAASERILTKAGFEAGDRFDKHCAALGEDRAHVDMHLTRDRWSALQ